MALESGDSNAGFNSTLRKTASVGCIKKIKIYKT